jgi:hypothetical protein
MRRNWEVSGIWGEGRGRMGMVKKMGKMGVMDLG